MQLHQIHITSQIEYYVTVEAETREEAWELADMCTSAAEKLLTEEQARKMFPSTPKKGRIAAISDVQFNENIWRDEVDQENVG